MNICIIAPSKDAYSETFIKSHIERLQGVTTVLYGSFFPRTDDRGTRFHELLPFVDRFKFIAGRYVLRRSSAAVNNALLAAFMRRRRINVALAEYGQTGASVARACEIAGVPLVVHFHGYDAYADHVLHAWRAAYARMFSKAAAIVAVSRDMSRRLFEIGVPAGKLQYCPYGVDTSIFSGATPGKNPPVFLAVGRFVEKKRPYLTLLAFYRMQKRCPDARLIMAGDGPLLHVCKDLSKALGMEQKVSFPGVLAHDQVARQMRSVRVFVQHSARAANGDCEGTPVSVLEACASGLPTVVTNHCGIAEVVQHEQTGFLVDEGDVDAMARFMGDLALQPQLADTFGTNARKRVVAVYSIEHNIAKLGDILKNA